LQSQGDGVLACASFGVLAQEIKILKNEFDCVILSRNGLKMEQGLLLLRRALIDGFYLDLAVC
jgi:hypothetical protein